jgi:hemerythrin-like domain-containing protein
MKSTQLLKADHEIILEALHILSAIDTEIKEGSIVNTDDIHSLLTFLREFADGCHHVKEEAIFFPALMRAGLPPDQGPLRVMNYEHERGRALTAAMQDAINRERMDDFLMYSSRYVQLLSEHIEKEHCVLFEKADQILSDDEDEKVAAAFEHFEATIVGAQTHYRLQHTIEVLASKYLAAAGALTE